MKDSSGLYKAFILVIEESLDERFSESMGQL